MKYPVLYLLHGSNDTAIGWVMLGNANFIMDNLIAAEASEPMIVVMPNGHAVPHGSTHDLQVQNAARFESYLLEEVIPIVEDKYRVRTSASDRAIAGLSMGGGQALRIGLRHPDRFHAIGSFSGSAPKTAEFPFEEMGLSKDINRQVHLLWLGCGREDFLLNRNKQFSTTLRQVGIDHELHLTAGVHNYAVWRRYLAEFAPRLFRPPQACQEE